MTDVLVIGDTYRSPELRHEVPLSVPDPFVYLERDGERHIYIGSMEVDRIRGLGAGITVHPLEEIGIDELNAQGLDRLGVRLEWAARACEDAGLERAAVPHAFPAGHFGRLTRAGVELTVDQGLFDARRRVKTPFQLEGIRRAQRAAEAGMATGAALLGGAENGDGLLWLDGEPLTVERVKTAIAQSFAAHGCTAEDFIVAPGAQGASGHDAGHGPIPVGATVVFDLWPRDDASSCFADMTRTFVAGTPSDDAREWHRLTKAALDAATGAIGPGVSCRAVFDVACDVFEAAGFATQRTKQPGEVLRDGFFHALGHGVGLEVHEGPLMGFVADGEFVAGDVVAVEPGLYVAGVGGVRLEDLVLVTDEGCEVLTRFPYDLEV